MFLGKWQWMPATLPKDPSQNLHERFRESKFKFYTTGSISSPTIQRS